MGQVFAELKTQPAVFAAYNTLYELAQLRPHRTVAFVGFDGLRATDAAMMVPRPRHWPYPREPPFPPGRPASRRPTSDLPPLQRTRRALSVTA